MGRGDPSSGAWIRVHRRHSSLAGTSGSGADWRGATGVSYSLGCIAFMPLEMALGMPYARIFIGILTFGIFFTGLAPLLAVALTQVMMALELNRRRIMISLMILTAGWMLSGITGYLLGNA